LRISVLVCVIVFYWSEVGESVCNWKFRLSRCFGITEVPEDDACRHARIFLRNPFVTHASLSFSSEGLTLFWQPRRRLEVEFKHPKFEWMTSRDVSTSDSRRITRSLMRALASRTSGATDSTNAGFVSQRTSVRRAGVTFAGTSALRQTANIISQDPSFSAGAQAAAHNILCGSGEGTAWSVPPAADNDASFSAGQWTVYSGLCSNSEDESAAQGAGRTRRSASTPPADRSRLPADRSRHDDLTRRIGQSPSSERRTTEEASSSCARRVRNPVRLRRPRRT
jgi:hypothetical protein